MKLTGYLKLEKPEDSDVTAQDSFNTNFDKLDKELSNINKSSEKWDKATEGVKIIKDYTISSSGWVVVGSRYRYTILDKSITGDTIANISIDINDLDKASQLYSATDTVSGKCYLYSRSKPYSNIKCDITLLKEVK